MIRALLPREKVNLLVPDERGAATVTQLLTAKKAPLSNLILHNVKTADVWIRDYGPIFVDPCHPERGEAESRDLYGRKDSSIR